MTSAIIQARAPGKIILMGEHPVLHGCPAIATSLGLYCNIQVRPREDERIELQLPDLNFHRCYTFHFVLDYAARGALLVIGAPGLPELAQFRRIHAPLAVDGLEVSER